MELTAFVFGFIFKRAPGSAGVAALIVNPIVYGLLLVFFSTYEAFDRLGTTITELAFLNRMAISFVVVLIVMYVITVIKPLPEPKTLPVREEFDMRPAPSVIWLGALVIIVTLALYVIFW